jgi:pantetheine-phosphate adenylyltransferase
MASRTALYPGSFDPMTLGHLDILRQSMQLFDRVVVAIGTHHGKTPLFSFGERAELITEVLSGYPKMACDLAIVPFQGLVVDLAKQEAATALVRGVRDGSDLDYEMQMAGMNWSLAPALVTVFLPGNPQFRPITATLVRQIAAMSGDVAPFVPPAVAVALRSKFA